MSERYTKQDAHNKADSINSRFGTDLQVGRTYNFYNIYINQQRETIATCSTYKQIYTCLQCLEKGLELAFGGQAHKPQNFPPLMEKQQLTQTLEDDAQQGVRCSCGSQDFTLTESLTWKFSTTETANDEDKSVSCYNKGNRIDAIACSNCDTLYQESDFTEFHLEFNFQ